MAGWKDLPGGVVASTVYSDGALISRNATVTLPEVSNVTAEIRAGGTVEVPITGQVEAMEMTVTQNAADEGLGDLASPGSHSVEVRWVQDELSNDGTLRTVGYKAFVRAYSKTIPGVSVEVGSLSENECTLGVTRYQLFRDGAEILCIDQLNGIYKVNGTDYAASVWSLL